MNTARWVVGFVGTWFILSALSENQTTADLAAALAISVAITATFYFAKDVQGNLGAYGITGSPSQPSTNQVSA
jgi:hypothetical protein